MMAANVFHSQHMEPVTTRSDFIKLWIRKGVTMAIVTVLFGYFYQWAAPKAFPISPPPGFALGMLHGALMPIALPSLVMGKDVPIYSTINTGRYYKIGYIAGINLCGLVFFGPLFYKPSPKKPQPTSTSS